MEMMSLASFRAEHSYNDEVDECKISRDLGKDDVLLGRGTGPNEHVGNIRFRDLVMKVLKNSEWAKSSSCGPLNGAQKKKLALKVFHEVKARGGKFVMKVSLPNKTKNAVGGGNFYQEVPDALAIDKTKQSFRHQIARILHETKKAETLPSTPRSAAKQNLMPTVVTSKCTPEKAGNPCVGNPRHWFALPTGGHLQSPVLNEQEKEFLFQRAEQDYLRSSSLNKMSSLLAHTNVRAVDSFFTPPSALRHANLVTSPSPVLQPSTEERVAKLMSAVPAGALLPLTNDQILAGYDKLSNIAQIQRGLELEQMHATHRHNVNVAASSLLSMEMVLESSRRRALAAALLSSAPPSSRLF